MLVQDVLTNASIVNILLVSHESIQSMFIQFFPASHPYFQSPHEKFCNCVESTKNPPVNKCNSRNRFTSAMPSLLSMPFGRHCADKCFSPTSVLILGIPIFILVLLALDPHLPIGKVLVANALAHHHRGQVALLTATGVALLAQWRRNNSRHCRPVSWISFWHFWCRSHWRARILRMSSTSSSPLLAKSRQSNRSHIHFDLLDVPSLVVICQPISFSSTPITILVILLQPTNSVHLISHAVGPAFFF